MFTRLTGSVQGSRSLGAKGGPVQERPEHRAKCLPNVGEAIFDLWRNLRMHLTPEDLVSFELSKLLNQHLLRDAGDSALQFRKPHDRLRKEVRQDHHFPPALETTKRCLHGSRANRPVASAAAPVLCRCGYHLVRILAFSSVSCELVQTFDICELEFHGTRLSHEDRNDRGWSRRSRSGHRRHQARARGDGFRKHCLCDLREYPL